MQAEINRARREVHPDRPDARDPFTSADFGRAVWQRYMAALAEDQANRDRLPSNDAIKAEQAKLVQHFQREGLPPDPLAVLAQSLDLMVLRDARTVDQNARQARLDVGSMTAWRWT